MWTSDIIKALQKFEQQFNESNTACIEDLQITSFGMILINYGGTYYGYSISKEEWVQYLKGEN